MAVHEMTTASPNNQALAPRNNDSPLAMLATMIERGTLSIEAVQTLVQLHREEQDRSAAREFAAARAQFQAECPIIPKSSMANITTKSGAKFGFPYAELDQIAETVGPTLHRHGFSYSWDAKFSDGQVECVCSLRHANGHCERATFTAPTDAASSMTGPQRNAAALTYAKRQSLLLALGISTGEPSDDAMRGSTEVISAEQVANLEALIAEVGADPVRFCAFMQVKVLTDIRASEYGRAVKALEEKRRAAK